MSGRSDCRKFAPNIFNKSKCTNCFRQKEEHSAEALESNRASRKISKCGYLFVAPGWDFSNPLYRTKRWQRRWFVLYDDGELTYSLDEHPDTVPQASIDMTTVLEVSEADSVTGHPHSLAVTAPERVTFVKGTCREEARWWADVLSVYPRSKGRHKRNATFPGGQTASLLQSSTTRKYSADASTLRDAADGCGARPRYSVGTTTWPGPRVQPPQPEIPSLAPPQPIDTKVYTDQPVSSASPPTRDKINGEEKARSRRRDTWAEPTTTTNSDDPGSGRSPLLQQQHRQYDEQLRDIAASLTRPRSRRALPPALERPTRLPPPDRLPARGTPDGAVPPEEGSSSSASEGSEPTDAAEAGEGGEGGEGGRVELPAERLLHARAGWLQRRGAAGWSRHWFVLRGAALLYFRDPHAEHRGLMDGVIDLSGISRVVELPTSASTNGYAFETETWDGKHIVLSAVTAGIRANWVSAMRRTAGLPESKPLSLILRDDAVDQASESSTSPITPVTPITSRSAPFSSDEEYRTASEGGRRDSADWGDMAPQPPPSPILSRTPISKVKEKVRARGFHQTPSREALKTDKDEIDSAKEKERTDEVDENEKPNEPRKRSYVSTIDKQSIEIDDLRRQLKLALGDVNAAESELARLRKLKSEAALREKKMEDLVTALQQKEEELSMRTKEAESLDAIKQMYNQDKSTWETKLTETQNFLKESTEHCELLTRQLASAQETVQQLQRELNELNEKLLKSVKENDNLYVRIRELEGRVASESPVREKRKSIGSLSDLSNLNQELNLESLEKNRLIEEYVELRGRFLKAIQEIKAMKKELRESHNMYDELEISNMKLRNEMKLREQCSRSEIDLMAARILDLTQKLTASDKQVRTLKHKIQKSESREKRRSLSLKGRESFALGKEVEEKLTELENKITLLETGEPAPIINSPSKSASPAKEKTSKSESTSEEKRAKRLAARLRRKSLDSATSSEPMKMLVRLTSLETKITSALETRRDLTNSCESLSQATRSTNSPVSEGPSACGTQAQRHLLDRLQTLESVVIHSRDKVNECLCQMSAMRAARSRRSPSPSPGLDKKHSIRAVEKCLADVSGRLQECFDRCVAGGGGGGGGEGGEGGAGDADDSVARVVVQLEEQLRAKLLELARRKAALYEAGELTQRRSLEILAEKLAYEAVLVSRIQEALDSSDGSRFFARLIKSEIIETSQLIDNLKCKLSGESGRGSGTRSSLDYLARILSRRIDHAAGARAADGARAHGLIVQGAELDTLRREQRDLAAAVERYKGDTLAELCGALAAEAGDAGGAGGAGGAAEARVRSAWAAARDALGAELVQAEVARALARAAQLCERRLGAARDARLTLTAQDRADLELWWQAAHDHLRCELDAAVRDIAARYRACAPAAATSGRDSRALLQQLAEVLAHKALVDARVAVVEGTYRAAAPPSSPPPAVTAALDEDPAREAEFVYLFQHFSNECRALFSSDCSGNSEDLTKIGESLERVEAAVATVTRQLTDANGAGGAEDEEPPAPAEGVLGRVEALRRRVEALQALVPCQHCKQLQDALDRLSAERARGAGALAAARRARAAMLAQHERERAALRERARTLQRRLAALDSEYSAQLDSLRAAYQVSSQNAVPADAHGDGLRVRYQQEIEQLRALCEKGLLAMESSHRRIVREMEDKHRAEREQLRLDKEQALAEETRATLAALDAMRKAHENEVRREVDKFKAEFLTRGQHGDLSQLSSRHQQEMEEIKREILSLSEKYSVKCVESAALEDRLAAATAQLQHAHSHILQLDARNKHLRAHIVSESNDMKNGESYALPQLIEDSGAHGREAPVWTRLRPLADSWPRSAGEVVASEPPAGGGAADPPRQDTVREDREHQKPAAVARSELTARRCSLRERTPVAPLVGMVAERKKRFEL